MNSIKDKEVFRSHQIGKVPTHAKYLLIAQQHTRTVMTTRANIAQFKLKVNYFI
jgi:hypothetical protein